MLFPLAFGNAVSKKVSIWQSLERQRGLRSFGINTRDESCASNVVLNVRSAIFVFLFFFLTVPDQHTTSRQPLYSLSVKLLKSLTVANDVFCVWGCTMRDFKGRRGGWGGWSLTPGRWQEPDGLTG